MIISLAGKLKNRYFYKTPMNAYSLLDKEFSLSSEEQQALNLQRRIALFQHAFQHIPFYRKKYVSAGFNIYSIKNDSDFSQLPLLTKAEVRSNAREMIAEGDSLDSLLSAATGGSTGEPVRFYYPKTIPCHFLGWPAVSQLGIELQDSFGLVGRGVPTLFKQRVHDFIHFPLLVAYLNAATSIDTKSMSLFADKLIRIRAKYIRGYVGGIIQFAYFCRQQKIKIPSLRLIWTSSAPLPESQRHLLQETFECPAYTQYGCCEMPWLGMECKRQCGLHTYPTIRHLEITDEKGKQLPKGTIGNVVITDLLNLRFPLIRYVNGDRSSYLEKDCDCGNHAPLINYIQGRVTDCLTLSDGSVLFGDYLTTVFDHYPDAVKAFQFHQLRDGTIKFRIVKNPLYTNSTKEIDEVITAFQKLIAGRNIIEIEYCSEINHDRGKTRFVIQDK